MTDPEEPELTESLNEFAAARANGDGDDVGAGPDIDALAARVDAHADDLIALLELLAVVRGLSDDLVPELRAAAAESREPVAELRTALEHEETMALLRRVGENADALADLVELAAVARDLSAELTPELRAAVGENRRTIAQLRMALESEETVTLLRRLGDNTGTFLDLLATLEVASDAIAEVTPADEQAAAAARADIDRLARAFDRDRTVDALVALGENMDTVVGLTALLEGFGDGADRTPEEYYRLGQRLGAAVDTAERASDPAVLSAVEAGADAVADDTDRTVGVLGLVGALRNDDVKRSLGTLVEAAERIGRERRPQPAE